MYIHVCTKIYTSTTKKAQEGSTTTKKAQEGSAITIYIYESILSVIVFLSLSLYLYIYM